MSQPSQWASSERSNGEVEGPDEASGRTQIERSAQGGSYAAGMAPRAHNFSQRQRRQAAGASRTPPTIVSRHGPELLTRQRSEQEPQSARRERQAYHYNPN